MDIRKEFETLQYFFDSYYNQTFFDARLEDKFLEFLNEEPKWVPKALKQEIQKLEQIYNNKDIETWKKIEELVHENSMRYFPYEDGKEFIEIASKLLKNV
ncbi:MULTISPECIES: hypothetical protein [Geobacillus]|uniref:hypothetical protein n=1 Tax=Geobacillus TaxID=129337 RepID=UPI00067CC767|nr:MULTISPECIES: hypothetical protein [Geobacillus]AKU27071.1 hypothetical protein IB49_12260 [Geobacillus sp. LC300]MBW7644791.1 hypothetical protein [Geobacillus thermoleovorans]NNV00856.1 hypothetical protein [Geobacillus sp. DSP4a]PJW13116.1 hypothetical protein CV945_15925 [Geobacillus sp. Manikaran-105]PJW16365.1 hypothetical protein CV944_14950 [Geobacillus sp. WSUCF-018B]